MHIGYVRVSTQDQDLRLQYEALCPVPFQDEPVWP